MQVVHGGDRQRRARRIRLGAPVVATNNVHYAERSDKRLHDALTCISHLTTLPEGLASGLLHPNSERYLKSPQEMGALFQDLPQALCETRHVAERCRVDLDFSAQRLPAFPVPEGYTPASYLRTLCEEVYNILNLRNGEFPGDMETRYRRLLFRY